MNTDYLIKLFRSVNDGTVNLVDSLSVFSALSDLNNQSMTEADFFTEVLRILLENRDIECGALFLKENEYLRLVSHAEWGHSNVNVKYFTDDQVVFMLGEGSVGRAAKTELIVNQQCKTFPEFLNIDRIEETESNEVISAKASPSSILCVPLINHKVVYGVLCLHHSNSDYFNAKHERFFSLFAQFLVQMLLNNRYTEELESQLVTKNEQLKKALEKTAVLQKDVQDLALIDYQTGLPNRQFYCNESQAALARSNRHGRDFSCCLIEICQFKNLLDEQGLFAGDNVLQIVADILKLQVREGDILAYLRGEQFVLGLPEVDAEGARLFGERIIKVLEEAKSEVDELAFLDLKIGLSTNDGVMSENTQKSLEELMYQADRALQAGKRHHKDIFHFSDTDAVTSSTQSA